MGSHLGGVKDRDVKNPPYGKDPDAGNGWRWEEKGTTADDMVGWHHRFDGHEFEPAPGVGYGQGSLVLQCMGSDMTERLNWTKLKDREAWDAIVHESVFAKSQTRLSDWTTITNKKMNDLINLLRLKEINPGGRSQDGGGIGRGDHFLSNKFIERTIERWTKSTKQLLITSNGHQAPRKAAHCLRREVGQNIKDKKGDKKARDGDPSREGSLNRGSFQSPGNPRTGRSGGSFQISEGNHRLKCLKATPSRKVPQMPAPATSKRGRNGEERAAFLRVGTDQRAWEQSEGAFLNCGRARKN